MRPLTDEEVQLFDGRADHTNHTDDVYCCPHCLDSSYISITRDEPVVVSCPKCSRDFVAWQETEIVYRSAHLPDKQR